MPPSPNAPEPTPERSLESARGPETASAQRKVPEPSRGAGFQQFLRSANYEAGAAALSPRNVPGQASKAPTTNARASESPAFSPGAPDAGSATVVAASGGTEFAFDNSFTPAILAAMAANPGIPLDEVLSSIAKRELASGANIQPHHHPTVARFGQTTENTNMTRAGRHMASLVANSTYVPPVTNLVTPGPEAEAFRGALASQGYQATVARNQTAPQMDSAFSSLVQCAEANDDLVAYYSGHGSPEGLVGVAHGVGGQADILANSRITSLVGEATGKGAHIRFVLDSCHSGSVTDRVRTERSSALKAHGQSGVGTALLAVQEFARWSKDRLLSLRSRRDEELGTIQSILEYRRAHPPPRKASAADRERWNREMAELQAALLAVRAEYDRAIADRWALLWNPLVAAAAAVRLAGAKVDTPPVGVQDPGTIGRELDWLDDLANAALRPVDQAAAEGKQP